MKQYVYVLIDCNNFYASCERVFNAALHNKPIIVLSNNDGCVVARSNEVKKWVKMGQPVFEIRGLIAKHNIQLLSSNYSLYADMSHRVMTTIAEFSPVQEIYSIDEAWIDLSSLALPGTHTEYGQSIRSRIAQYTGIPVSVGIASTKTLAKVATEVAKHNPDYHGVLDLTALSEREIDELLETIAIEDVWMVGPQYARFLRSKGVHTAKDLKYKDVRWVRRYLTVVGERTVLELRGTMCIPIEPEPKPKKGMVRAKSFGRVVESIEELSEAVATYTARLGEKLRAQESMASSLTVFVRTSHFHKERRYANAKTIILPFPTAFTPELISHALEALRQIYQPGIQYVKAGVYLTRIVSADYLQPPLFGVYSLEEHERHMRLMLIIDAINKKFGPETIFFGACGIAPTWKMRQAHRTPRYTTHWSDILTVADKS